MLSVQFPERVDAAKLFARFGRIDAAITLTRFTRLVPYLAGSEGEVQVNLQFGLDAEGRKLLTGSIAASLELVCQRCLKGMQQSVVSELSVLVFANQAELEQQMSAQAQESLEQDVLLLDEIQSSEAASTKSPDKTPEKSDQELDVIAVVEDELILSLPLAPMHEDIDCSKVWTQIRDQEPQEDGQGLDSVGNSPFAMLAKLKKDNT